MASVREPIMWVWERARRVPSEVQRQRPRGGQLDEAPMQLKALAPWTPKKRAKFASLVNKKVH